MSLEVIGLTLTALVSQHIPSHILLKISKYRILPCKCKCPPGKASIYVHDILAFTGCACSSDYGILKICCLFLATFDVGANNYEICRHTSSDDVDCYVTVSGGALGEAGALCPSGSHLAIVDDQEEFAFLSLYNTDCKKSYNTNTVISLARVAIKSYCVRLLAMHVLAFIGCACSGD